MDDKYFKSIPISKLVNLNIYFSKMINEYTKYNLLIKKEKNRRFNINKNIICVPIDKFLIVKYWHFESYDFKNNYEYCDGCVNEMMSNKYDEELSIDHYYDDWKLFTCYDYDKTITLKCCDKHIYEFDELFTGDINNKFVRINLNMYPKQIGKQLLNIKLIPNSLSLDTYHHKATKIYNYLDYMYPI